MFSKTQTDRDSAPRRRMSYANVMSTISVFMVLAGGTALAAQLPANSVSSKTVKDNKLKSVDLKDGAGVSGADVVDASLTGGDIANGSVNTVDIADGAINSAKVPNDALTGADIDETTLGQVPTLRTCRVEARRASCRARCTRTSPRSRPARHWVTAPTC